MAVLRGLPSGPIWPAATYCSIWLSASSSALVIFPTAPRLPAPVVAKPAVLAAPVADVAAPDVVLVDVPVPDISISLRRKSVAATELPRRGEPQRAALLF